MSSEEWNRKRRMSEEWNRQRMKQIVMEGLKWYRWRYKQKQRQKQVRMDKYRQQQMIQKVWNRLIVEQKERVEQQEQKAEKQRQRQQRVKLQKVLHGWKDDYHDYYVQERKRGREIYYHRMRRWMKQWKQYMDQKRRVKVRMERVNMKRDQILMNRVMIGFNRNIIINRKREQIM